MKNNFFKTLIVLGIITYFLIESWITILTKNYIIQWRHLTGLILFIPLPILLFKNYKVSILATGIYLLLGIIGALSLTAWITSGGIKYFGIGISGFNWLCLGLFLLHFFLHLNQLIEMQLDYQESKAKKPNNTNEKK